MKKLFTIILMISLGLTTINAQTSDRKWALGLYGGKTEYNGDFGSGFLKFDNETYGFIGASINRYLCKSFDVNLLATYGTYGFYKDSYRNFKGIKADGDLLLVYKLNNDYIFKENATLAPFINGGIGVANNWSDNGSKIKGGYDMLYIAGAGLKLNISDNCALQYQLLYNFTNHDDKDFWVAKDNDNFIEHSLGLVFKFCPPKDSDGDGVPDKLDKCPGTPSGAKVDANGCPIDSDGDGIADYLDKCPDIKGLASLQGCPDSDGDGITDADDKCPNTPTGVKVDANGCPIDSDGDGVPDYLDKCSNTPKDIKVDANGCPIDSDGDGVPDYLDKCSGTPKGVKVDANGCPIDTDGDGIPDYLDKCPTVPGIKENKGCPEVKAEVKKVFEQALQGIQFETGKDVIIPTSFPILDKVVKVMTDNKEYNLEINGHTDNIGNETKNQTLSQKRADAVKIYLTKKGIDASRMTATGFGSSKPVEDNKTAEGRAKNRRVEFKVNF